SGRTGMDQLLSCVSRPCRLRRIQAIGHRPRNPQDDAVPLSADEKPARQLQPESPWLLLRDGAVTGKVKKVVATEAALELIERLKAKYGPVMFHQSGGCCDGSSPMCYPL